MQNYQSQKNNPYRLPHELYMRMLYLIRDYKRIRQELSAISVESFRFTALKAECDAVESALQKVPEEYRTGVMNNICKRERFPLDASVETYSRWRRRFIHDVAKNLHLI